MLWVGIGDFELPESAGGVAGFEAVRVDVGVAEDVATVKGGGCSQRGRLHRSWTGRSSPVWLMHGTWAFCLIGEDS
jgi:hypothetical protein